MNERTGHLIRQKFKSYLLPTLLMTMALSFGNIVDSFIVSRLLGKAAFSAVTLCLPITLCYNSVFAMFGVGGATLVSFYKGRKDNESANKTFTTAVCVMIFFSIIFLVLGLFAFDSLTSVLGKNNADVMQNVRDYTIALILGAPVIITVSGVNYFIRSDGNPKLASKIIVVSNVVNLVFDYLLVGVVKIGILGASVSTVLGYIIGGLLLIQYIKAKDRTLSFVNPRNNFLETTKNIASTGLSSGLNTGLMFVKSYVLNSIILTTLGSIGIAAFSVCTQALVLSSMFIGGTIQTILPIIGVLYGEEDKKGLHETLKVAAKFAGVACVTLFLLYEIFALQIASMFLKNSTADELLVTAQALRAYALILPFYAFNFVIVNFYQTTQKKLNATFITLAQGILFIVPSVFLLSLIGNGNALWFGFVISETLVVLLIFVLAFISRKKSNGALTGLLLEKACECNKTEMEVTITNKIEEAVGLSNKVMAFCEQHGINSTVKHCAGIATEEMTVNIIKHGYNKDKANYIDITVRLVDGVVIIRIRDDGVLFNPITFLDENMEYSGISTIKKIAKDIQYMRVIGFNTTIIKV